jgi:indolepyruvate ferredoxin oxidoreductase
MLSDLPRAESGERARSLLSGIEAVVQIPLLQHALDARAGLRTATVISGYPGSPLGTLDLALERQRRRLEASAVTHVPGLNEELAATIVWGSQQKTLMPSTAIDGVVGIWYGKSPGVDRCGDVFKHANSMGSAEHGGVLVIAGDDPSAKSSTLPNDSRSAFYDAQIPVLTPATVAEIVQFGLHGIALSRYSGLWTGLKIVTNLADGFESVVLEELAPSPVLPRLEIDGRLFVHTQRPTVNNTVSVLQEAEILNGRIEAAKAYALANGINRVTHPCRDAWLGIAAQGKSHADVVQALRDLGLETDELARAGVRILKIGMPYPLEPVVVKEFAAGLDELLVVEEKRPLVETFVRDVLYGHTHQPRVVGKRDEHGRILVPGDGELTPARLGSVLRSRLGRRIEDLRDGGDEARRAGEPLPELPTAPTAAPARPARAPAFCSGCPHNRSTAGPADALVGGGVGCHAMVYLEERHLDTTLLPLTPMGAEGVMWIGAHRFAEADHMFQNLGDGTLAHSGSLAIRACVAANVNITFKILFNSAVAMTGGQHVAGATEVPALTRELEAMGVKRIIVAAEDPDRYEPNARWADGVTVWHRDRLPDAERELAASTGVTIIIYDQRCAAEARRLRRRGELPRPTIRTSINEAVCEGCGDCQKKSNCLSVLPVDTPLGRKTRIHQSSCNQDLTCLDGDCPSFVTIDTRTVRDEGPKVVEPPTDLRAPSSSSEGTSTFDAYMVGIGGTGVVTANRLLGTVALGEGWSVTGLDQTGLSQKGGSVVSHLRVTRGEMPAVSTVGSGGSDVYFAFDALAASEQRHLDRTSPEKTTAVISSSVVPTIAVITQPMTDMPPPSLLEGLIERSVKRAVSYDAQAICEELLGDHMPAHVFLIGVAYQHGLLPFPLEAIEHAIGELGAQGSSSLAAFRWGRAAVARPEALHEARDARRPRRSSEREPSRAAVRASARLLAARNLMGGHHDALEWYAADLVDYQDRHYAGRYLELVSRVIEAERELGGERSELSETVARHLYRLMAYKDEYEVARLHLDSAFAGQLEDEFPGAKVTYRLHPPILRALGMTRKIAFPSSVILPFFRMLRVMRRLRGTPADPFGFANVRRVERTLIAEYATLIDSVLSRLSFESYDAAVELAATPEAIRGYEEIKLRSVEHYESEKRRLVGRFEASPEPVQGVNR